MAHTQLVQARVDGEVKAQATAALANMGLTVPDAVRILLTRVAREKRMPLELMTPNATTLAALEEVRAGDLPRANSVEALFRELNADVDLITPGEILLAEFMEPNGVSQTKLAGDLDMPQSRIADIIKGKRGITVDTALRFSVYFSTSINFWLNLQNNYDIEKTERSGELDAIVSRVRQNANLTSSPA